MMKSNEVVFKGILIYPFFYIITLMTSIDASFANIYFSCLLFFVTIFLLYKKKLFLNDKILLVSYAIIFILIVINFSSFRFSKPLFFFFYCLILYISLNRFCNYYQARKFVQPLLLFILVPSISLSFFNIGYTELNRFYGFLVSPTVFTVFLDAFFILYLFFSKNNKIVTIFIYLILFYLHVISGTRLNLLFLLAIPFLYYFSINATKYLKIFFLFIYIVLLNFIYPAYNYFSEHSKKNIVAFRYDNNKDTSFSLRYALFNTMINDYLDSSINDQIFGKGSEYNRQLIVEKYGKPIFGHNDFIRILLDFGICVLILYMGILIRLSLKNELTFLLVTLYLLSFYHNMIYSYFLISLIFISSTALIDPRKIIVLDKVK